MGFNSRYQNQSITTDNTGSRIYTSTLLQKPSDVINTIPYQTTYGERLDQLAERFYGDTELWWVIAVENGYDNGRFYVETGTNLHIPDPSTVSDYLREVDNLNQS